MHILLILSFIADKEPQDLNVEYASGMTLNSVSLKYLLYAKDGPYIRLKKMAKTFRKPRDKTWRTGMHLFLCKRPAFFYYEASMVEDIFLQNNICPKSGHFTLFFSCLLKALGITTICTQSWIVTVYA
jgi:hypothetical protein